jgi:hypothetical protein
MKKNTDHLIKDLVFDLKPVQIVKFHFSDLLKIIVAGLFCVFAAVSILGLRTDINVQTVTTKFVVDTLILLLLAVLSIMAAFSLSVPSMNTRNIFRFPIFVFSLVLITTVYSFLATSNPFLYLGHGFSCVSEMIAISILPAAILFYLVRKAAVIKRDLVGILILMSGVSFGLLGVQLTCADSTPLHILIWHFLPSLVVIIFGIWLSRRLIKKI